MMKQRGKSMMPGCPLRQSAPKGYSGKGQGEQQEEPKKVLWATWKQVYTPRWGPLGLLRNNPCLECSKRGERQKTVGGNQGKEHVRYGRLSEGLCILFQADAVSGLGAGRLTTWSHFHSAGLQRGAGVKVKRYMRSSRQKGTGWSWLNSIWNRNTSFSVPIHSLHPFTVLFSFLGCITVWHNIYSCICLSIIGFPPKKVCLVRERTLSVVHKYIPSVYKWRWLIVLE